jgi:Recombinase
MRVARKAQATQFAANVLPIIRDIQAAGHTSLNAIAGQLNARKVATANGGQWRHVQVGQILQRASSDAGRRAPGTKVAN